jgi:hypothetical protein
MKFGDVCFFSDETLVLFTLEEIQTHLYRIIVRPVTTFMIYLLLCIILEQDVTCNIFYRKICLRSKRGFLFCLMEQLST